MEIRFCDECGKRISEPRDKGGDDRQLCDACLAASQTAQVAATAPTSSTKNTAVLAKRSTAQIRPARQTEKVGSGLNQATKKPLLNPAILAAIAAGVMLGIGGFILLSGPSKESKAIEKNVARSDTPAARPVTAPAPAPVEESKAAGAEQSATVPSFLRSPEPAGAPHELTPKEEYDLRIKRGEAKPVAQPVIAAPAEIPASNEEWKEIFNGKDLNGFHIVNGNWNVEDGVIVSVLSDKPSRMQTNAQYGDFELKFKFMLAKGRHSELQLRQYSQIYPMQPENGVWKDVVVKAFGPTTTATMDSTPLRLEVDSDGKATVGVIGFYASKGSSIKLKDISIRPIRKP